MAEKRTTNPLPALLLTLSAVTGLVDAVSVLGLGKVFTANMTGNVVFLGFAMVHTPGFTALPLLLALGGFLLGSGVAGRIGLMAEGGPLRRWLLCAASIEASLFAVAALVACRATPLDTPGVQTVIVLTALAMGLRNATVRLLKVPDLTTTVVTLTLAGLAADSRLAGGQNPNFVRRVCAVAAILAGAAIGAALVNRYGLALPLLVAGLTTFAATALCSLHPDTALPRKSA